MESVIFILRSRSKGKGEKRSIRQRTKLTDETTRTSQLKWDFAGHMIAPGQQLERWDDQVETLGRKKK